MAENKTKLTAENVKDFINKVEDDEQRKDSLAILEMMKKATGEAPAMWGSSLIGFGNIKIKSAATGREADWFKIGFSPRKANISLYLYTALSKNAALLKKLGKHKTGAGCLYIKKLADIDVKVLQELIDAQLKKS